MEKNRKNSGNGGLKSRRIPSRAVHGWTEGVETRRRCGIAHRNTPTASGIRKGEEIVPMLLVHVRVEVNGGPPKCACFSLNFADDWHPLLTAMDWTATAAANENVKPEESPT